MSDLLWAVGVGALDKNEESVVSICLSPGQLFLSSDAARFMAQQLLLTAEKVDEFNTKDGAA